MPNSTLGLLKNKREELVKRLEAVAPDLMREFLVVENAIRSLEAAQDKDAPYRKYRKAIDAVEDFLKECGKPMPPEEIVETVLSRGWLPDDPRRRTNVFDSLRYFIKRSDRKVLKLFPPRGVVANARFIKDWDIYTDPTPIGLFEWPDPNK